MAPIGPSLAAPPFSGEPVEEMVLIPAGPFLMGGEFDEERPRHRVVLDAFLMDRHEVTNEHYAAYLLATGAPASRLWNKSDRFHSGEKFPRHPAVGLPNR
ncbi:MAG: SUMF1/EgtB/PvdO family nonheme iron enzyme [Nitrospirae bacterium]|nr:SUMF1/EgtB/PvdO family nonheme iron enzyme [Nitrospirota bacterium]